jgi:sugar lactone lactonase YvrE
MKNSKNLSARLVVAAGSSMLAALLSGCGMSGGKADAIGVPIAVPTVQISGTLHGGQQPISGGLIQLYAVGNTGPMSAATPLISQTVLTGTDGTFAITGKWNCTDNVAVYGTNPLLYIVATGGNPGLGAGGSNSLIAMMAALGPCNQLTTATFISINELTTVASVYALAPFMSDYAHVGVAASNMTGLKNAFNTVNSLVDTRSGATPGPAVVPGETIPTAMLSVIANVMSACVNTNGSGNCQTLFGATMPAGGSIATDTIGSLLQMVHAPSQNVPTEYGLISATPPFPQSAITSAPNDWTVAVNFTGGGISGPTGVAIDAAGNAWIANATGSTVTGLDNQGTRLTGANGYAGTGIYGAQALAVDGSGNVWVADTLLSSVVKLSISSNAVQGSTKYTNGISGPAGIAIDKANHVWVANFANGTVIELGTDGSPIINGALSAGGTLQSPAGVAIDASGNAWITDNSAGIVVEFDKNQNLLSGTGYTDGAIVAPLGIATDAQGKAWVAGNGDAGVSLFAANGTASAQIMGGGLNLPAGVAIDGGGIAWVTNNVPGGSISQVNAATATGGLGSLNAPAGIAVDASGNVWTANSGDDSVTKFVGLASPVKTPLVANVGP